MLKLFRRVSLFLSLVWTATTAVSQVQDAPASNAIPASVELREKVRGECIEGRRAILGRIIRVFPDGLVIDCGYTNLVRGNLTKSWLVPGRVVARRADNLVEGHEAGAVCVGTIFLTDLPRGKPHPYDYVILAGFPAGMRTYRSVGNIQKTVRHFSANLDKAVEEILAAKPAATGPAR